MSPELSRGTARRYVLDSNALIGFFEDRPGTAGKIERLVGEALRQDLPLLMSAVNWGEVFYTAWKLHSQIQAREVDVVYKRCPSQSSPRIGTAPPEQLRSNKNTTWASPTPSPRNSP